MPIVFAQGTYDERIPQTLECIRRVKPYVDRMVIVVDQTVSPQAQEALKAQGSEVYYHEWKDNFVEMRNNYLSHCQYGDWVLISDPDEWFDELFLKEFREVIIPWAEKDGYNLLLINAHDVMYKLDGTEDSSIPDWFKFLCLHYAEGVKYAGVGETQDVHETIVIPNKKAVNLPKKYFYQHTKHEIEVLERSSRNTWISGGGSNRGAQNPYWRPLRRITDRLGLKSWRDVRQYLRKGGIDQELRQWIADCRTKSGWDFEEEMFQSYRYYRALHPTEMPEPTDREPSYGSPPEVEKYVVRTYLRTMGRYPDSGGKEFYLLEILNGRIQREALPQVLLVNAKPEEIPSEEGEQVKVRMFVDVSVNVPEQAILSMSQHGSIWNNVKPWYDLGKALAPDEDFFVWYYANRERLDAKQLVERLVNEKKMGNL